MSEINLDDDDDDKELIATTSQLNEIDILIQMLYKILLY